jgi:hypothetical protein
MGLPTIGLRGLGWLVGSRVGIRLLLRGSV